MRAPEIIENLRARLATPGGRHLYGVCGTYAALGAFATQLRQARTPEGKPFPEPTSVTRGILKSIPDDEFRRLAEDEAKHPEPVNAHVARAFEGFLRNRLKARRLVVLSELELLFAYGIDLGLLRVLSTDEQRIILLLPGRRSRGRVVMFPDHGDEFLTLPTNLVADNHLWEVAG